MKGGCWGHVENLFASIRKTIILDMDAKEVSTEISKKKQKMEEHRGSIVSVVTEWIAKFGIRLFF